MRFLHLFLACIVTIPSASGFWIFPDYKSDELPNLETPADGPSISFSGSANISSNDPQSGSADWLQSGLYDAWPLRTKHRLVRYCYANEDFRKKLECSFQKALALWSEALGGEASEANRHSLGFYELKDHSTKQPMPCYKNFDADKWKGVWNPLVPADTLALYYTPDRDAKATVGYMPKEQDNTPGRHWMKLCDLNGDEHVIAHEIGHVLGMVHEQCRTDRDDYVEYRPENVRGFLKGITDAIKEGLSRDDAYAKLRDDYKFAEKHGFLGVAFIKGERRQGLPLDGEGGFDYESIMLYPSNGFATSGDACNSNQKLCPIVRIKKDNGVKVGDPEVMEWNKKPSAKDAEFVRKFYPWGG